MRATPELIAESHVKLRCALRHYTLAELRWDYCCNVSLDTKQIIADEVARRGVSMQEFQRYGRGIVRR